MKKISETIVFFGSGPVAAKSLALLVKDFSIEAVITKPKPKDHKYDFPVIETAKMNGLKHYYTNNKQELKDLITKNTFNSRLGLVIDFGIIIPNSVINSFELGIVNSHFSLLPKWRGADPITFAILNGDSETGVSLMLIDEGLDTGNILAKRSIKITSDINQTTLTTDLIKLSHVLLTEKLPLYIKGLITPRPQKGESSHSRKLLKSDAKLDFNNPAILLERQIRAFSDWPRSEFTLKNKKLTVTKARVIKGTGSPGSLYRKDKLFGVYCSKDILIIEKLIPEGKKEMTSEAFLAGYINLLS